MNYRSKVNLASASLLSIALSQTLSCQKRNYNNETSGTDSLFLNDESAENDEMYFPKSTDLEDSDELKPTTDEQIVEANKKFTKVQICRDYELAIHSLALIQAPVGRSGNNIENAEYKELLNSCPDTYVEVARKIRNLQRKLLDFHTAFHETQLSPAVLPMIETCDNANLCGNFVGAPLVPLIVEQGVGAYFTVYDKKGMQNVWRMLDFNGHSQEFLFNDMVSRDAKSHSIYGNAGFLGLELFYKSPLDLPIDKMNITVRNIETSETAHLTAVYGKRRLIRLPKKPESFNFQSQFQINRDYGCKKIMPDSNDTVGSCLLENDRGLVWIGSFTGDRIAPQVMNTFRILARQAPEVKNKPIILDLRGNGGGIPELAAMVACTIGNDGVSQQIENRELHPSIWPEKFKLSDGTILKSKDSEREGNRDLFRFSKGRVADSLAPDSTRNEYKIGFYERFKRHTLTGPARCAEYHSKEMNFKSAYVLTSGQEFSATENFLSFISPVDKTFRIVGWRSKGGTGAPLTITLPETKMKLRLSQARHLDKLTGLWPIEAVGVHEDIKINSFDQQTFEKWVVQKLAKNRGQPSQPQAPSILTKALQLPDFGG